jgi:HAD superfamily hydrolase (TIGR01509 family)
MNKKYKAVIFDFGGVVVSNSMNAIYARLASEFKLPIERIKEIASKLEPDFQEGKINSLTFSEMFLKEADAKDFKIDYVDKVYYEEYTKNSIIDTDVIKIIKELKEKGYVVPLLTDTVEPHARFNMEKNRFIYFDFVVKSFEIGVTKKSAEAFYITLNKIPAIAEECAFIDDSEKHIKFASELGLLGLLYKNHTKLREDLVYNKIL